MNGSNRSLFEQILVILKGRRASYSNPVSSEYLAEVIQVNPSYLRTQMKTLVQRGKVSVRRGKGGGYYLTKQTEEGNSMKIVVDGQLFDSDTIDSGSDLPHTVLQNLIVQRKSVVHVKVDGIPVEGIHVIKDIRGDRYIEIQTIPTRELFFESIRDGVDFLPGFSNGILSVARLFQEGNEGQAVKLFIDTLEGFQWIDAVVSNADECREQENVYQELLQLQIEFKEQIHHLLEAWENSDFVLVADLLEYEFEPILTRLHDVFLTLAEQG